MRRDDVMLVSRHHIMMMMMMMMMIIDKMKMKMKQQAGRIPAVGDPFYSLVGKLPDRAP
jgi:hypothetical protein